jgi:flagellar hook-associated protein 1 FlgK
VTSLSQLGYSGARASQVAMNTTGQNIANVNTPGFSRLNTQMGSLSGRDARNAGGGVEVTSIRRVADDFQNQQLWRATTEQNYFSSAQQYLGALEQLMSSDSSSISVGLDNFFAAISAASSTPESPAMRQQIISEAKNLGQRFNSLNGNIGAQLSALKEQRVAMSDEINGLNGNIAELNRKITETQAAGGDTSALRDHRDSLVGQLSQYAKIRTNEVPDGSLTVSLANGQPLVAGSSAGTLQVNLLPSGEQQIGLTFAGTSFPLQQNGIGGSLGALYDTEYTSLRPMQVALHDMAEQLADMVNSTLSGGFDLAGNPGQDLFVYTASSTSAMLQITDISAAELALSAQAGEVGDNQVLLQLIDLKSQTINLNGSAVTLNDAYAGLIGRIASDSRQNQADLKSSIVVTQQAQAQRDSVSAVNLDEEAVNLMTYQQAYQANLKVITTAREVFDAVLAAF